MVRDKAYRELHRSVKVTAKKGLPAMRVQALAEPIVETTGQGARERIEHPKTGIDKIVEKMNNFIQGSTRPQRRA